MIFDLQDDIVDLIGNLPVEVFDPRYGSIYLPPFLRGAFSWIMSGFSFTITHHYFVSFLRSSRPKVVLTVIDNNRNLYSARAATAETDTRFVIFQNGNRWLSEFPAEASLKPDDIFFCLTQAYLKPLRNTAVGAASVIPSGTLASKLHKVDASDSNNHTTAGYISSWRQGKMLNGELWHKDNLGTPIPHYSFYRPEHELLALLMTSLNRQGMKLEIIGSSSEFQSEELSFYQSILGHEGWTFSPRIADERSYRKLFYYPILFCVDSTLGYEALSLLKKVMFLDNSSAAHCRIPFAYPSDASDSSQFVLKADSEIDWASQISWMSAINQESFCALAASVVGETSIQTGHLDLLKILDTAINE